MDIDDFVIEKYVMKALARYDSRALPKSNLITCRCFVCNDSKNKSKRRGYFLKGNRKHDHWTYVCHNDSCDAQDGMDVKKYLKNYFPDIYEEFRKEAYLNNYFNDEVSTNHKFDYKEPEKVESDDVKHFSNILKGSSELFTLALDYCKFRKIPEEIYSKFFVATGGVFQGRLVIPFYDNFGKIYYYTARTLIGSTPKYLNRRFGDKKIYNIFGIDKSLPVIVLEGPIDSMFVKNSIAIVGLKMSEESLEEIKDLKRYFILDNDKGGRKNSLKWLQKEEYVFNWKKFLNDLKLDGVKDINDLVLKTGKLEWSFEDLKDYFTNDILDGVWFK